jgi:hypothetical protein
MTRQSLTQEWDDYLVVLREDAHQLLAWSYADTRSALSSARDEYDMTGLLASAMHERINSPHTPERFTLYSVHNERPISPAGELGKTRPKLDVQIEMCGIRPKRFYTFEAKRLRDDERSSAAATLTHYFGADGVGRFVSGRYEVGSFEAAMVGCVQAHSAAFWFERFEATFASDVSSGRDEFKLVDRFQRCSVIPELTDEASTSHRRVNGSKITLMHIALDCT